MLLIHDLKPERFSSISQYLPCNTKIISKDMNNIHPCIGCFKCWLKTPGKCVIDDDYTDIPKYMKEHDLFVIISEIKYGCYSSYIKNVIERSIGFILPFLYRKNNETHHPVRYKGHIPKTVFIGYGDNLYDDEKETFKEICKANAVNFGADDNYECHIVRKKPDLIHVLKILSGGNKND
ncbi:MAG: flavodoxin family protein [Clostridium sp.]